ncbi:hypothetical protein G6F56_001396 [Rhizopus delemar]|nr:hypothetical protein G6F56_001396 [Rhizopus delemar]
MNATFHLKAHRPAARNDSTKIADRTAWVEEWSKTDMDYLEKCVFVDESAFNINTRPLEGWSIKGTPAIVITPTTKAVLHTVLGAISAKYVVSMELQNPQEHTFKRLKIDLVIAKEKHHQNQRSLLLKELSLAII